MEALKAIKIIGNQNDGSYALGLCLYFSKYRVTKGFKFHARPQTGAYSCLIILSKTDFPFRFWKIVLRNFFYIFGKKMLFVCLFVCLFVLLQLFRFWLTY